jgi:malonyl CoA-acyl carrier protein transacylase
MKFIVKLLETRARETEIVIDASNADEAEYLAAAAARDDAGWEIINLTRWVSKIETAKVQNVTASTNTDAVV